MKKTVVFLSLIFLFCALLVSCKADSPSQLSPVDATKHGVSIHNSGAENSKNLQNLIDTLSENGGTIYIPSGEYTFFENGKQSIGSHCIKMKSNVCIIGDGETTVLKPTGSSQYGLDMFYFNDYLDFNSANYLENCRFENFTIDAAATACAVYTSAGKGFMFNLFRNCHFKNVTVKNTDATGFGVDCPLESSIVDCTASNCGKAATKEHGGASGFGIGFGYADGENLRIKNCLSVSNKKFGFFFEHQGRFNANKYSATKSHDFLVSDCKAFENLYNFGGICAMNTTYENCLSQKARLHGFYFENSAYSKAIHCKSELESDTSFVISQSNSYKVNDVNYQYCHSENTPFGAKIVSDGTAETANNAIKNCAFLSIGNCTVYTFGTMQSFTLTDNTSDSDLNDFTAEIERFINERNTWN